MTTEVGGVMRGFRMAICTLGFAVVLVFGTAASSKASVQIIANPISVAEGQLEANSTIWGFLESTNNQFSQAVNALATGTPQVINDAGDLTGGSVTAPFDSWFFHFDPVGQPTALVTASGSHTFSTQILGIIVTDGLLNATDGPLGVGTTFYPSGVLNRGLELVNQDQLTISVGGDNKTISFDFLRGGAVMDQVRVLTATTVPEPANLAIWATLGGLALIASRRRLRKV